MRSGAAVANVSPFIAFSKSSFENRTLTGKVVVLRPDMPWLSSISSEATVKPFMLYFSLTDCMVLESKLGL